jgi:hypothetical protein
MASSFAVYPQLNAQASDYYSCLDDHFETFIQVCE